MHGSERLIFWMYTFVRLMQAEYVWRAKKSAGKNSGAEE